MNLLGVPVALVALTEDTIRGDPGSPLRWVSRTPKDLVACGQKWLARLTPFFTAREQERPGIQRRLFFAQVEYCDNQATAGGDLAHLELHLLICAELVRGLFQRLQPAYGVQLRDPGARPAEMNVCVSESMVRNASHVHGRAEGSDAFSAFNRV